MVFELSKTLYFLNMREEQMDDASHQPVFTLSPNLISLNINILFTDCGFIVLTQARLTQCVNQGMRKNAVVDICEQTHVYAFFVRFH